MAYYGVIIPVQIAASNVDSWNRSGYSASIDFENGGLCGLLTKQTASGLTEVWTATTPATADLMNDWIVYDPELVWTGSYRGLDPDVRNHYVAMGRVFSAFKPQPHDLLLMSYDTTGYGCFTGAIGANTFANATDGQKQFVWGMTQSSSCISLKLIATEYISIGSGAVDNQRTTAYLMEVLPII
jgi:hypothetical protein